MWGAVRLVLRVVRNTAQSGLLNRVFSVKEWFFVSHTVRYCDLGAGVAAARAFSSVLNAVACSTMFPNTVATVAR